jgi:N-acetylneuraminic acid mutarotase
MKICKFILTLLLVIAIPIGLITCDNYEFSKSPYPKVETLPADIIETGVTFHANLKQLGDKPIINYGFDWYTDEHLSVSKSNKIELGAVSTSGNFEFNVKTGFNKEQMYFVKAFVATEDYTVYGNLVSFISKGSTPPIIKKISKQEGNSGDTVTIHGQYFGSHNENISVKFTSSDAKVIMSNDSIIECIVPQVIYNQRTFNIEVIATGKSAFSKENFTILNAWIRKADVPQKHEVSGTAFAINGMGYIGLGVSVGNKFWQYNPSVNIWKEVAPFPGGARYRVTSFVIGDKAYVGCGFTSNTSNYSWRDDFWSYDPQKNLWTSIANLPISYSTPPSPSNNISNIGLSVNGKGYIVRNTLKANFWEYNPDLDSWSSLPDLPKAGNEISPQQPVTGFVINNRLFIYSIDGGPIPNQLREYDFVSKEWIKRAEHYITNTIGFSVSGNGYLNDFDDLYKYDLMSNTWNLIPEHAFNKKIEWPNVFVINDKAYLVGGTFYSDTYIYTNYYDLWEFDPDYEQY